jgi:hypothetical protein
MNMMKTAALLAAALASSSAIAGTVTTTNPSGTSEIGSRIRWGGSGFEASIVDSNPFGQTPTLNPSGSPVWQVGQGRNFEISFDSTTGTLGLKVDFNGTNGFEASETISRSVFGGTTTSYTGLGFKYIQITGNESGSTGRSNVSDLVINGTSHSTLTPNGAFIEHFFKDAGNAVMTNILITGKLTFTAAGTSQERPSWNFNLLNAEAPVVVPLPAAAWSGLGLLGAVAGVSHLRKRMNRA